MDPALEKRINRIKALKDSLHSKLQEHEHVIGLIVYGSFSDDTDHQPTKYSDLDLEIIVDNVAFKDFLKDFKHWFEENFEPILIETRVAHLNKIFVTHDFVDLQFHISKLEEFDRIDERPINYFPNGYSLIFDKSDSIQAKINEYVEPISKKTEQQKFDELNSSFWYFVQGITTYIERQEYWFCAASCWAWLYVILGKLLRIYFEKEIGENNPFKHFEHDLEPEIVQKIQHLRNLETPNDIKAKMQALIDIYMEYIRKVAEKKGLIYDTHVEIEVIKHVEQYLK